MSKIAAQPVHSQTEGSASPEAKPQKAGHSRTDLRYWKSKVRKVVSRSGEDSPNFSAHIGHLGQRMRFPLKTADIGTAAKKARKIYLTLLAKGWPATLAEFKPKTFVAGDLVTVGDWLAAVQQHCALFTNTSQVYTSALRKLAADLAGIKSDKSRYDYKKGGNTGWREAVDKVKLDRFTAAALNAWRVAYTKGKEKTPNAQRRALNSARAHVRNAKALFGAKIIKTLRTAGLVLPPVIPFADVKLPELFGKRLSTRYVSKLDASALIRDASKELAPSNPEAFKILLLALLCGLRRREIDSLQWEQCDLERGSIRLEHTAHIRLKSEDSAGVVELDPELLALMRGWKESAKGSFVIEAAGAPTTSKNRTAYRCMATLDALTTWLRGKGINAVKPLHELRKEAGNLIAGTSGIFAASRFLRHSDIRITSEAYADKPQRISTGLGGLLAMPGNVVPFAEDKTAAQETPAQAG